jgi:hypothetical protein
MMSPRMMLVPSTARMMVMMMALPRAGCAVVLVTLMNHGWSSGTRAGVAAGFGDYYEPGVDHTGDPAEEGQEEVEEEGEAAASAQEDGEGWKEYGDYGFAAAGLEGVGDGVGRYWEWRWGRTMTMVVVVLVSE